MDETKQQIRNYFDLDKRPSNYYWCALCGTVHKVEEGHQEWSAPEWESCPKCGCMVIKSLNHACLVSGDALQG